MRIADADHRDSAAVGELFRDFCGDLHVAARAGAECVDSPECETGNSGETNGRLSGLGSLTRMRIF